MYPVYLIICTHPSYGQHIMPYVGVVLKEGKTVEQRFEQHLRGRGEAPYLRCAINKYGKDFFHVKQIDAGNTPEQALELEKFWIKRLGTKVPAGYNLTDGGEGVSGFKHSSEFSSRQSERIKGNIYRLGIKDSEVSRRKKSLSAAGNKYALGKHWTLSPETRVRMSAAQKLRRVKV